MTTMRLFALAVLPLAIGSVAALSAGCKDDTASAAVSEEVIEASGQLSEEEDALLQRRNALLDARRSLRQKRAELAQERARVVASGGDTSAVDEKASALRQEEQQLGDKEDELAGDFEQFFEQQRSVLNKIASQGGSSAQIAAREASLAGRERTLASRERKIAEREAAMAERERRLAVREKETCGVAAVPIVQAAPIKGAKYDKRDVEPLLKKARKLMSRKAIRTSDLPSSVSELEDEAMREMKSGDYGRAHMAASQLYSTVKAIRIDKAFIKGKIDRLNAHISKRKVDESTRSAVEKLFRQATSDYADGKFSSANRRLNKIYSLVK